MPGTATRTYLVTEDDEIIHIPKTILQRFYYRLQRIRSDLCHDKKAKICSVLVKLENRKPVMVLESTCSYLYFDESGYQDYDLTLSNSLPLDDGFKHIGIDLDGETHHFIVSLDNEAKQRQRTWQPSTNLLSDIHKSALGIRRCQLYSNFVDDW